MAIITRSRSGEERKDEPRKDESPEDSYVEIIMEVSDKKDTISIDQEKKPKSDATPTIPQSLPQPSPQSLPQPSSQPAAVNIKRDSKTKYTVIARNVTINTYNDQNVSVSRASSSKIFPSPTPKIPIAKHPTTQHPATQHPEQCTLQQRRLKVIRKAGSNVLTTKLKKRDFRDTKGYVPRPHAGRKISYHLSGDLPSSTIPSSSYVTSLFPALSCIDMSRDTSLTNNMDASSDERTDIEDFLSSSITPQHEVSQYEVPRDNVPRDKGKRPMFDDNVAYHKSTQSIIDALTPHITALENQITSVEYSINGSFKKDISMGPGHISVTFIYAGGIYQSQLNIMAIKNAIIKTNVLDEMKTSSKAYKFQKHIDHINTILKNSEITEDRNVFITFEGWIFPFSMGVNAITVAEERVSRQLIIVPHKESIDGKYPSHSIDSIMRYISKMLFDKDYYGPQTPICAYLA
jgi:hypothetical protein